MANWQPFIDKHNVVRSPKAAACVHQSNAAVAWIVLLHCIMGQHLAAGGVHQRIWSCSVEHSAPPCDV